MATVTQRVKTYGVLGEFDGVNSLLHAAERMRDAGFTKWDAHSPFPIHGMDRAMGLKRSIVGYIAGACGLLGGGLAFAFQMWALGVDYPLVISGKPYFAYVAYIPITFGLTVLGAALGAVIGMLLTNRLPQPFHGLFYSERFGGVNDDKFFISVDADDPKFDPERTRQFLTSLGATYVEIVQGP
jgi:hypothetical protein